MTPAPAPQVRQAAVALHTTARAQRPAIAPPAPIVRRSQSQAAPKAPSVAVDTGPAAAAEPRDTGIVPMASADAVPGAGSAGGAPGNSPTGTANGSSAPAAPVALDAYAAALRASVADRLEYPVAAERQGLEGLVVVVIAVDPHGTLVAAHVETSSGHASLDAAALRAVRAAAPWPALPRGASPGTVEFTVPVRFALD